MEIIERKDRHRDGVAIGCMERTTGRSQTGKQERSGQKRVFHDDRKFKQGTRPAAPAEALTRQSYTFLTGCPLPAAEKNNDGQPQQQKKRNKRSAPFHPEQYSRLWRRHSPNFAIGLIFNEKEQTQP